MDLHQCLEPREGGSNARPILVVRMSASHCSPRRTRSGDAHKKGGLDKPCAKALVLLWLGRDIRLSLWERLSSACCRDLRGIEGGTGGRTAPSSSAPTRRSKKCLLKLMCSLSGAHCRWNCDQAGVKQRRGSGARGGLRGRDRPGCGLGQGFGGV